MKKVIAVSAIMCGVLITGTPAWAGGSGHHKSDDHKVFKKIVHVLDGVLNGGYRTKHVYVYRRQVLRPKKVCYISHGRRICHVRDHRHHGQYKRTYHEYDHGKYCKSCKTGHSKKICRIRQ